MNRRKFIGQTALAFAGLQKLLAREASAVATNDLYGALVPDPAGILDLPHGFSYTIISEAGQTMSDGLRVPGHADGMAAFSGKDGKIILIRNHELTHKENHISAFHGVKNPKFDATCAHAMRQNGKIPVPGGTTTIVYDPEKRTLEKEFLSLAGTDNNCAGGAMPWGSWITCEETADLNLPEFKDHGYCFEVMADPDSGLQQAKPLKALGRFRHEAVCLDPVSRILYLTEDRHDGLFYRFIPEKADDFTAGQLQALAFVDDVPDNRNYASQGPAFPIGEDKVIRWIDMDDVDSAKDDLRHRGKKAGAAYFARGEGITYNDGSFYICCTNGGNHRQGQIFKLTPGRDGAADQISLFIQPEKSDLLTNGDNLCTGPGGHMIICEDLVQEHAGKVPHVRGVTPDGEIYTLAKNAKSVSEFAGSCWHEDSQTLFINIQNPGQTIAIHGPWRA